MLCAEFLEANYDQVFTHYQRLLNSENYVTRRQSLKLLGELLLDRHNFTVGITILFIQYYNRKLPNLMKADPLHSFLIGYDEIHIESG